MSTPKIYGIKNCDTMKKAFKWLEASNIAYEFHDYKKQGVSDDILEKAIKAHGWEAVINKRGTTWRQLPKDVQENMDAVQAIKIAQDNPSIIKRPLLTHKDEIFLGFKAESYAKIFNT